MTAKSKWGVAPHCERGEPTGNGFVVREILPTGGWADPQNYRGVVAVRIFARRASAEKLASYLTFGS